MEGGLANTLPQQTSTEIPAQVYQQLLNVALLGYDSNDVKIWYENLQQHLRRIGAMNPLVTYGGITPASDYSLDARTATFLNTDSAARRMTAATIESCTSSASALPTTEEALNNGDFSDQIPIYTTASLDSGSQQYTPRSYNNYCDTPQHLDSTREPSQSQSHLANWSPAPSSAAEQEAFALSMSMPNNNPVAFAGETTTPNTMSYPWFSAQDVSSIPGTTSQIPYPLSQSAQHLPTQQQTYLAPDYNTQLSGASMPVIVPYATTSSTGNNHYTKAAAIPTAPGASLYSSSSGYFPIIHVSSSRRRRKALQKGVKKIVQPLTGRRQQSV